MYDRMQTLSQEDIQLIHDSTMDLLGSTGVAFNEEEALELFRQKGYRVKGKTVFFTEEQIRSALETCPAEFTVSARNPDKSVTLGGDGFAFLPGYGAPFITGADGSQRQATMADYDDFCRLVQTSDYLDMNGFMMVEPHDVPPETAHLDMLLSSILLCDKPFMGSPVSREGAAQCVEMLKILHGDRATRETFTVSLCNSLSPLQFSSEMAGSLMELARANQACCVASLIMAGSSGPVTLAGVLALQNAEILAGIALAQAVRPGAPVIYGSTSSAMDMRTGGLSIGAPELSQNITATALMARYYNLPSRSGGGLTDSLKADGQAGAESALAVSTAVRSGINFILHAAGILGSYISMSFEKFILDEEVGGMIKKMAVPLEVTPDSIDLEMIKQVGIGGQYLTQPKTFKLCRTEFFNPRVMSRSAFDSWNAAGRPGAAARAGEEKERRLSEYTRPDIGSGLEKDLKKYVVKIKG